MPAKVRDQLTVERIPYTHGVVSAGRHHKFAIGTEECTRQRFQVPTQLFDELAVTGPKTRRAVATAGYDCVAVRTETHSGNVILMTTETEFHLAGRDIPDGCGETTVTQSTERCIRSTFGREKCPIRTKREGSPGARQAVQYFALVTIKAPDHCLLVSSLGREVILIGTERDLTDGSGVAPQDLDRFAGGNLPHTHCVVVADADKITPVRTEDGAVHLRGMPLKLAHRRSAAAVPNSDYAIRSASRYQLAVRTKRRRVAALVLT